MSVKERLTLTKRDARSVAEYLQIMKGIVDELALINTSIDEDDLVLHILNGLGPEFKEISTAIRARETPITFEELHDKLIEFEQYLKRNEADSDIHIVTANHIKKASKPSNSQASIQ